jgi:endonuclease/exonuclease/phosphatase family metal-dependent hydrolase
VKGVRRVEIGVPGREPRALLDTDIEVAGIPLRVLVTHFGLRHSGAPAADRDARRAVGNHRDRCTIVIGDFNEWAPVGHTLRRLHAVFGRSPAVRSFPSPFPALALDRIWVHPARALLELRAHRSRLAGWASDHLPVLGVLEIPA